MSEIELNEEFLKNELTPEQYATFKEVEKNEGLEEAIIRLPEMGDGGETFSMMNRRIKELRIENGLSQNDLANILDVSQKEYWRYEQEGYSMHILRLAQLAIFYNVSIDWFSGYYPTRKPFFPEIKKTVINGYNLEEYKASKKGRKKDSKG